MGKRRRVHEIAKEMNVSSKEVINGLKEIGISVKSHMSTIDSGEAEKVIKLFQSDKKDKGIKKDSPTADQKEKRSKARPAGKGHGIVDRVPQRPPDRRYQERPIFGSGKRKKQTKPATPMTGKQIGGVEQLSKARATKETVVQKDTPKPITPVVEARPPKKAAVPKPVKEKPTTPVIPISNAVADERKRAEAQRTKKKPTKGKQTYDRSAKGKKGGRFRRAASTRGKKPTPVVSRKKPIVIEGTLNVQEFAAKVQKKPAVIIKKLMDLGVMATINQAVDPDTAVILGNELGFEIEIKTKSDLEELLVLEQKKSDDPKKMRPRPSVVTVMGHVDHGKTSLLDAIRDTKVTSNEFGGITQHIGAYQVEKNKRKITFIDTPGHEAFTAMRARGARVTDVAILVVAADDGVMPQTIEAINHAKAAKVPIIVAVNKIDRANANPERVRQQLTEYELVPEDWGGDTVFVEVSALKREGIEDLLEMILLVAEMQELLANPERLAIGNVIEAQLDKGRGPVATILVRDGTLHIGDNVIAGSVFGKVRAMMSDRGRRLKKAGPSTPVQVLGFSDVPAAGDIFQCVEDEKLARQVTGKRQDKKREEELRGSAKISLDDLFKQIQEGNIKELPIIIKADVQGSAEALKQSLERLSTEEVKINLIHRGVGAITETDIMLASASNAIIIGFNVRPDINARKIAESEQVDIRLYRVIYDAIEDIKAAMGGLLDPEYKEVDLGRVEIRKTFKVSRIGTIAGCYVTDGKVIRDAKIRLIRDGIVIYEGKLDSLKRFKDDVREVSQGYECGLTIEGYNDIKEDDIIEAYTIEAIKRKLE
ncbi:MAG TPA: translation initiation factor IF-2 [Clostridia bacterium]|nr:translation initiation factor IF-2 [Clostridia bacterium]